MTYMRTNMHTANNVNGRRNYGQLAAVHHATRHVAASSVTRLLTCILVVLIQMYVSDSTGETI